MHLFPNKSKDKDKQLQEGFMQAYKLNLQAIEDLKNGKKLKELKLPNMPEGRIEVDVICYYFAPDMAYKIINSFLEVNKLIK